MLLRVDQLPDGPLVSFIMTLARDNFTRSITGYVADDVVERQLAVRLDIVVAWSKKTGTLPQVKQLFSTILRASVLISLPGRPMLFQPMPYHHLVDAYDALAVVVSTAVGDVGGDLLARLSAALWAERKLPHSDEPRQLIPSAVTHVKMRGVNANTRLDKE